MSPDEYVPSEEDAREAYALEGARDTIGDLDYKEIPTGRAEFDRFLARVRRDAWDEGFAYSASGNTIPANPHEETP